MSPDEKATLYLQHPDECPELTEALPYLIHPPGKLSATASWVRFRDKTLLPLIASTPEDRHLPQFLRQAEAVIAWRASIPVDQRFWKPDPST